MRETVRGRQIYSWQSLCEHICLFLLIIHSHKLVQSSIKTLQCLSTNNMIIYSEGKELLDFLKYLNEEGVFTWYSCFSMFPYHFFFQLQVDVVLSDFKLKEEWISFCGLIRNHLLVCWCCFHQCFSLFFSLSPFTTIIY